VKRRSLAILVAIVAFIPMSTPATASEVATMDAFGTTITWNSPVFAPTGNRPCVSLVMRVDVGPAPTVPGIELQLVSGVPGAYKSLSEHQFVSLPPVGGSVPAVLDSCFTTYASHDPPYALTVRPLAGAAPLWQRNFTDVVATQIDLRDPRILSHSSVSSGRVVLNAHEIVVLRTCWQEGMVSPVPFSTGPSVSTVLG